MAARNPFASSIPDIFDDPYGLVQSRRPVRHSTGYYFVRNLLLVGAVAGGVVALYRNDVFRDLSRRAGLEQRYLDAEKFLVGTPGWGTPRSMEPVLNPGEAGADAPTTTTTELAATTAAVALPSSPAATTTSVAEPAVTAAVARTATPEPVAAPSPVKSPAPVASPAPSPAATPRPAVARAGRGTDSLSPVSFDSLPTLTHGGAPRAAAAEPPAARAVAPVPVARAAAPAPVAHAAPTHPAPVDHSHAKAIKVSLEEDAPAQPASHHAAPTHEAPPPAPVATKPAKPEKPQLKATEAHEGDNPLLAAVRGAVRTRPSKSSVPAAE